MRLFVAVYPPAAAVNHLAELVTTLAIGQPTQPGRSLRLVNQQQWHLTMAFLGEVPEDRCEAAAQAVAAGVADRAAHGGPLVVRLGGSGALGRSHLNPVCVGVLGDVAGLRDVAHAVRTRLRAVGLPFDGRPMRAHLTLARPGERLSKEAILADRESLGNYRGPEWRVDEVRLMRSELGPHPRYTPLGAWPLAG